MINYERKEVSKMAAKIDLTKYGITGTTEIVYNPSYEMLFEEETKPERSKTPTKSECKAENSSAAANFA